MAISIEKSAARILAFVAAVAIVAAPVSAASPLSLSNAPGVEAARAAAELESPNGFGSTKDILLVLGALGAGLLAAVEWWFDKDDPRSP